MTPSPTAKTFMMYPLLTQGHGLLFNHGRKYLATALNSRFGKQNVFTTLKVDFINVEDTSTPCLRKLFLWLGLREVCTYGKCVSFSLSLYQSTLPTHPWLILHLYLFYPASDFITGPLMRHFILLTREKNETKTKTKRRNQASRFSRTRGDKIDRGRVAALWPWRSRWYSGGPVTRAAIEGAKGK